jgi:outer membrane protein assembly factor BamA
MSFIGVLALAGLMFVSTATPQPSKAYNLTAVQVKGAKRFKEADVTRLSGLTVGQPVRLADVTAAAERLGASGLFKSLNYRYVTNADGMTVIFEFEEADWTVPVLFDNFVWFSADELTTAVRRDVPSFDGTAPPTEGVTELVTRSLGTLLKARNLAGQVQYTPESDLKGNLLRHVFSVRSPAPRTCALHFAGAAALSEQELAQSIHETVGSDYSRLMLEKLARGTLTDVYRQRGFWRATFDEPAAALEDSPTCSGVTVRFVVTEGSAYTFDHVDWSGNTALAADKLDALFGMKTGEVAGITRIDAGIRQLKSGYGDIGFVLAVATYATKLDDAARRAVFLVEIKEGSQFRMGTFDVRGVSQDDAAALRAKWHLASGEVFNASYPLKYRIEEIKDLLRRGSLATRKASLGSRIDPDKQIVDVWLSFE